MGKRVLPLIPSSLVSIRFIDRQMRYRSIAVFGRWEQSAPIAARPPTGFIVAMIDGFPTFHGKDAPSR